jgi:hypothetical protein
MSNMRNFHGLRRKKAMGKTARRSPARPRSALGMEHPAILPWLYSSVGYAAVSRRDCAARSRIARAELISGEC